MSYQVYTTDAIVCGTRNQNTSDRSYLLLTRHNGMVWASAKSVREERSKQRFALQNFSFIRISLVKGKQGWRVGSVESLYNAFLSAEDRHARHVVTACITLVRRLVHGEGVAQSVFTDLENLFIAVTKQKVLSLYTLEHFTLRTLASLGYIAPETSYESLLINDDWWNASDPLPNVAKKAVEFGFAQSHL